MAVIQRSSRLAGWMMLAAFVGVTGGYLLVLATTAEARGTQGPSRADILAVAERIEGQEGMIADIMTCIDELSLICDVDCDPGGGDSGDCCIANGTPGCEDPVCEAAICAIDSFCCDTEWDGLCAGLAAADPACFCDP
jgi:hypothetical protein